MGGPFVEIVDVFDEMAVTKEQITGPEVREYFSCSTQLRMKFVLLVKS